jgi:hypothetical protein
MIARTIRRTELVSSDTKTIRVLVADDHAMLAALASFVSARGPAKIGPVIALRQE